MPIDSPGNGKLAPHVRAAITAGAQAKMGGGPGSAPGGQRPLAPHVLAAIAAGVQRKAGPLARTAPRPTANVFPRVLLRAAERQFDADDLGDPDSPASKAKDFLSSLSDGGEEFRASNSSSKEIHEGKTKPIAVAYLFHETFAVFMDSIKKYGLWGQIPAPGKNKKTGLPFADPSKMGFTSFAKTERGASAGGGVGKVMLRLVVARAAGLTFREFVSGEVKTAKPVPVAALQYWDPGARQFRDVSTWET